jgi:hypothetical protein
MAMEYGWRSFRFDLPAGLEDESVLTFLSRKGEIVDLNLTFTRDKLPKPARIEAYLLEAADQMKAQLSGYRLVSRQSRKLAGRDAFVLEHATTAPDGATLKMLQAYVPDGDEVLIVTATAAEADERRLAKTFEDVITSLRAS